jgi:hypothetical protein
MVARQEHTQYGIHINSETSSCIRPGKNNLLEKNALAYLATASIIKNKRFVTLKPDEKCYKHFTAVTYDHNRFSYFCLQGL